MEVWVEALATYPLKSAGGIRLEEARVETEGLELDRQWMLVDSEGRFLSQRRVPQMALLAVERAPDGVRVSYPGKGEIRIPAAMPEGETFGATMHRSQESIEVVAEEPAVNEWFGDVLAEWGVEEVRLVRLARGSVRRVPDLPDQTEFRVQLSDGYPFLVTASASLRALNERLQERGEESIGMNRFRPNLVLGGPESWQEMAPGLMLRDPNGPLVFRLAKPCQRCGIPQVNPGTGERDLGPVLHQLLRDMNQGREDAENCFGQNAVLEAGAGQALEVGQALILEPGTA